MKKIIVVLLAAAMMLSLTACDSTENETSSTDQETSSQSSTESSSSSSESSSSSSSSGKLSDSELEEIAVETLYTQLVAFEKTYKDFDADKCRYEISTIERDNGQVEVYGRVAFYDKYGGRASFGGDYTRNFTIHMTEWGKGAWCKMS